MKTNLPDRIAFLTLFACTSLALSAQPPSNASNAPPLGLLRAAATAKAGEVAPLASAKFSTDQLAPSQAPGGGSTKSKKDNVDYLALDAAKQWSSTLRGNPREPTYASFMVHGSQNTIVEIGGARLGVTAGSHFQMLSGHVDNSVREHWTVPAAPALAFDA